jgi:hypothetical protein
MEDVSKKFGRMLNAEASHEQTVDGHADHMEDNDTIAGQTKNLPLMPEAIVEERSEAAPIEGKSTII